MNKLEIRKLDINGVTENADGTLTVSGYVNETNTWSQVLGTTTRFIEKIVPGAFKRALEKAENVEFLFNHDKTQILADVRSGKLELHEDEKGLYMKATIVPTSWGKDAYEMIKGGLVKHMSFGFRAVKHKITKGANDVYERIVEELELGEVSAVRNPAYLASSIATRSLTENIILEELEMEINLQDRYKEIVTRGQEIHKTARADNRELNSFELEEVRNLETEMNEIKIKIEAEEKRAEIEIVEEKRQVIDKEYRAFEALVHGVETEETRALTSTNDGAKVIPTTVSKEIVEKVLNRSNIFKSAKQMEKGPGFDTIMSELEIDIDPATGLPTDKSWGWIGKQEFVDIKPSDFTLRTIKFDQKRAGTAVEISDQAVYASGMPVVPYVTGVLEKRLAKHLDNAVLFGTGGTMNFEGVLTVSDRVTQPTTGVHELVTEASGTLSFGEIYQMALTLHSNGTGELEEGAAWYMNWETFNLLKKMKTPDGYPLLKRDKDIYAKFLPELLGIPVVFDDNMPAFASGNYPILLGNFGEGYGVKVKKELNFQHIWKDKHSRQNRRHLLLMDIYADGKIIRPEAFVRLKVKA